MAQLWGLALLALVSAAIPGVVLGVLASWHGERVDRALVMLSDAVLGTLPASSTAQAVLALAARGFIGVGLRALPALWR